MSLTCNQLLEMSLNKEGDDCFEGSSNEHNIFTKVFFGGDTGGASKRCVVTGVINFECESSKNADVSLCYNSERSAVVSQSSEDLYAETYDVSNASRRASAAGFSLKRSMLVEKNDRKENLKRMKFSVDGPSNNEPDTTKVLNCSTLPKGIDYAMSCLATEVVHQTTSFHLLELSFNGGGVRSSNYLLKHNVGTNKGGAANMDALNCTLPSVDGKYANVVNTIASPVSQESFTNRCLAANPSMSVVEKSGFSLSVEKLKGLDCPQLDKSHGSVKRDPMKSARNLLHSHVGNLFIAAGWRIEKCSRPSRNYKESVYISPQGKLFRDFPKAWRLLGELLFVKEHTLLQKSACKEWTDFSKFYSDLSYALTNIEKQTDLLELSAAMALTWCILDPFVMVVCICRKIGALKKGELVKVSGSLVTDMNNNLDPVSFPKNKDGIGSEFVERPLAPLSDSSLAAAETVLQVSGVDNHACVKPSGIRGFSKYTGQTNRTVKLLTDMSNSTANNNGMSFIDTSSRMGNLCCEVSRNRTSSLNLTPSSSQGLASTSIQSANYLFNSPINSENCGSVVRNTINTNLHFGKDASMDSWEERGESLEDNLKCGTGGCFCSHGSDKTYVQLDARVHGALKLCRPSLSKYSILTNLGNDSKGHSNFLAYLDEPISPEFVSSEVVQQSGPSEDEGRQYPETVPSEREDAHHMADISKKKIKRKSRKISEIKLATLYQSGTIGATSSNKAQMQDDMDQMESNEVQDDQVTNMRNEECQTMLFSQTSLQCSVEKKLVGAKKIHHHRGGPKSGHKICQIKDDDLLVSAIIKNKDFCSNTTMSSFKPKVLKSRALRKLKSQKSSCRLLPRSIKGGMNFTDGKWSSGEARTILSWLIDSGVISLNDVIVYRNPKDEAVVKDGLVSRDGINCKCCNMLLSVSKFNIHAGFKHNRPCLNLFMESGKAYTLCLLQAWSAEYKTRKSGPQIVRDDHDDQNDDSCGLCGDGGELICCDNCPSTFHQTCLPTQELPEGSWYCLNCTCRICGDLVNDKVSSSSTNALKCSQCEHKYHESCLKEKNTHGVVVSDSWFCGGSCQEIYSGLHSRVGLNNCIAGGFSWTLLRCIHDDQKVHSAQRLALKAECNSKLAVALGIMEECFLSMVDPRTGINMIPQVLYNWGSEFARLNFHGFFSAVLEKDDTLLSVASIRVHGVTVAEMPLIATCSKYRRQGMCRRLLTVVEETLIALKVEKLVISAIPSVVDTWTEGFGFVPVEPGEKESLNKINLMVFPGTVLLKKTLYWNKTEEKEVGGSW